MLQMAPSQASSTGSLSWDGICHAEQGHLCLGSTGNQCLQCCCFAKHTLGSLTKPSESPTMLFIYKTKFPASYYHTNKCTEKAPLAFILMKPHLKHLLHQILVNASTQQACLKFGYMLRGALMAPGCWCLCCVHSRTGPSSVLQEKANLRLM